MVIKFQSRQYELISKIKTTGSGAIELYTASDDVAEGTKYTIACVNDLELARKLVPVTTKANTNFSFKDLHASFNADGRYYVVFGWKDAAAGDRAGKLQFAGAPAVDEKYFCTDFSIKYAGMLSL